MAGVDEDSLRLLWVIGKWRFLLSRQIVRYSEKSKRTTYRYLKQLIDLKYVKKEHILYGVPALYTLAHKGKKVVGINKRENKYRLEQITHDIYVVDTAFYFMDKYHLDMNDITSEKELHSVNGFGSRKHVPDFIFSHKDKSYCVEVELSLKSKETIQKNAELNFMNYDVQLWVISKQNKKLKETLDKCLSRYPNIVIQYLDEVLKDVDNV